MSATTSVTIISALGSDPFSTNTTLSKRSKIRKVARMLSGIAGGAGVGSAGITKTLVRTGTAAASGTVTAAAVAVDDTVTINGTALTAKQHNATGTVTCATVSVDDTVTINSVVFTAKATADVSARQFSQAGSDTADAASLVACINGCTHSSIKGVVTASNAAGVVTIRAVTGGTGGNSIALATSNNSRLAKSGTALANGATVANNQFDCVGTNTETGDAFVAALAASSTSLIVDHVAGSNASGVVTISAKDKGVSGNAITLASSNNSRLAVTGARLTGGTTSTLQF